MKKVLLISLLFTSICISSFAQEEASLGTKIKELTYHWDTQSLELDSYDGLGNFCSSPSFRTEVITLLQDIHHYDSVLYDKLTKAARMSAHNREIAKAIEEIEKFEKEYTMKSFIRYLHTQCNDRNDVEKHADALKGDVASDSYGGQIYIIESELNKYIKHITKRVDHIRKHVDHLHVQ
jgi:hypothetical protein